MIIILQVPNPNYKEGESPIMMTPSTTNDPGIYKKYKH